MRSRRVPLLAGVLLIVAGALLALVPLAIATAPVPPAGQNGQSGEQNSPVAAPGVPPTTIGGVLVVLAGIVLAVFGLLRRTPATISGAPPVATASPDGPPEVLVESRDVPPGTLPGPSADVEAAVIRLLDDNERLLYTRLRGTGKPILQRDVVGWGTFSAATVSRLLDRLERKGLLARERYGATNRIRLTVRPLIAGK